MSVVLDPIPPKKPEDGYVQTAATTYTPVTPGTGAWDGVVGMTATVDATDKLLVHFTCTPAGQRTAWAFGDGEGFIEYGGVTSHHYAEPGTYQATAAFGFCPPATKSVVVTGALRESESGGSSKGKKQSG